MVTENGSDTIRRTHAAYFLALAEEIEPRLVGQDQLHWLVELENEYDNLRATLRWAEDTNEVVILLRCAGALARFWQLRGYLTEGRNWLARGLLRSRSSPAAMDSRAKAIYGIGMLAFSQGDLQTGRTYLDEALGLYQELGNVEGTGNSLLMLGNVLYSQGALDEARARVLEGVAFHEQIGNKKPIADSYLTLGNIARTQGNYQEAHNYFERSLSIFRELNHKTGEANASLSLGIVSRFEGDNRGAYSLFEESLRLYRELGYQAGVAAALGHLGKISIALNDYESAHRHLKASLDLALTLGAKEGIAFLLETVGQVALAENRPNHTLILLFAAKTLRRAINAPLPRDSRSAYNKMVADTVMLLDRQTVKQAWRTGRAMTVEQAIAFAVRV
jgi:tetratricopeptide (TPR) repeat protein